MWNWSLKFKLVYAVGLNPANSEDHIGGPHVSECQQELVIQHLGNFLLSNAATLFIIG